ncbi:MAG TPA: rRNA maturation RNase YbeY, partial [Gammaproteobacteria bacterium]|nr:rRNA maturation RNase YbeY [Gammaproteobacteria bacterium]
QEKSFSFHFAHMVVHGFLHLLGFDHQNDRDEKNMQEIENQVLEKISILQWVQ